MANRVDQAIARMRPKVAALDPDKRARLDRDMALTSREHFDFQQTQAESHAAGVLSPSEAQTIYIALGEVGSSKNGYWAPQADTATKVVVTQAMQELLTRKISRARGRGRARPVATIRFLGPEEMVGYAPDRKRELAKLNASIKRAERREREYAEAARQGRAVKPISRWRKKKPAPLHRHVHKGR